MTEYPLQLVIVSNRLPIKLDRDDGTWRVKSSPGGLVTAMTPVLKDRGGIWIGWPGTETDEDVPLERLLDEEGRRRGYALRPVSLTKEELDSFYYGFANEVLWPLFHILPERCNFRRLYWEAYQTVNRKYAERICENLQEKERYIWVHDYHLMLVGHELRKLGVADRIGYYLHIPFPPLDIFLKLPWRFQILRGLLEYDVVGFQTTRDRQNFVQCVRALLPEARVSGRGRIHTVTTPTRESRIGTFPISIDFKEFAQTAESAEVTERVERLAQDYSNTQIIFGLDRLDYTKGVPPRLRAFARALEHYPDLRRKVQLVQVVVPSREGIPAYRALREEIDELVGEINGRFTEPGWVPIHYLYRSMSRAELISYYRMASVGLVTPLIDGMNLVAKEYCASTIDDDGVLVLSEFAGAAAELHDAAVLVNPYDTDGVADAIYRAVTMDAAERKERMNRIRRKLRRRDVFWWLDCFLYASIARRLDDLPLIERFVPSEGPVVTADSASVGTPRMMPAEPDHNHRTSSATVRSGSSSG